MTAERHYSFSFAITLKFRILHLELIEDYLETADSEQFFIPFFSTNKMANVVPLKQFVRSADYEGALNFDLYYFLADRRCLLKTADSLYDEGFGYVGDLIQLSETDLLKKPGMNLVRLEIVKEKLSVFGLRLSVKPMGWKRPSYRFSLIL